MKRGRWKLLLVLACAVGAPFVALFCWPEREPACQGKTLSQWVEIYEMSLHQTEIDGDPPKESAERRQAVEAARQMRDWILPQAVRLIRVEKPEWKDRVMHAMEFQLKVRRWCPVWVWRSFYGDPGDHSFVYFEMLGSEAAPAIPELARIMRHGKTTRVRERAMSALACVGREALPLLLEVLGDPQNQDRRMAALAVVRMKEDSGAVISAVPLLVKGLKDQDFNMSTACAMVLGDLGVESEVVVPALADCLQSPDWHLRDEATRILGQLGDCARSAVPALRKARGDPDESVRWEATNALEKIEHGAKEEKVQHVD